MTLHERFWAKAEVRPDGCWDWTGYRSENGYGRSWDTDLRKVTYAHRVAYRIAIGPIENGKHIDHLCRNRSCVNPAHLEAVSQRENTLRGAAPQIVAHIAGVCIRGHVASDNALRRTSGPRSGDVVYCRACRRAERAA